MCLGMCVCGRGRETGGRWKERQEEGMEGAPFQLERKETQGYKRIRCNSTDCCAAIPARAPTAIPTPIPIPMPTPRAGALWTGLRWTGLRWTTPLRCLLFPRETLMFILGFCELCVVGRMDDGWVLVEWLSGKPKVWTDPSPPATRACAGKGRRKKK